MLRYNIKLNNDVQKVEELIFDFLYLSPDLTYMSGYTSSNYELQNNQTIYLQQNGSDDFQEYNAEIHNCQRHGYVIFEQQPYKVNTFESNDVILYGFTFADGKTYIADENGNLTFTSSFLVDGKPIQITGISQETAFIYIDTKYYVYDNNVTIGGINYAVDFNADKPQIKLRNGLILYVQDFDVLYGRILLNKESLSQNLDPNLLQLSFQADFDLYIKKINQNFAKIIKLLINNEEVTTDNFIIHKNDNIKINIIPYDSDKYSIEIIGVILSIEDPNSSILQKFTKPNIEDATQVIIRKGADYIVNVEHISFTKPFYYILSGSNTFVKITDDIFNQNNSIIKLYLNSSVDENNETQYELTYYSNNKLVTIKLTNENYNPNISIDTIFIDNIEYQLFEEWKNTSSGDEIHLYLDNRDYSFSEGQIILAKQNNNSSEYIITDDGNIKYTIINGKRYESQENDIIYTIDYYDNTYEVLHQNYTTIEGESFNQYYIDFDGLPILLDLVDSDELVDGCVLKRHADTSLMYDALNGNNSNSTFIVNKKRFILIDDKKYPITKQINVSYDDENNMTKNEYEIIIYKNNKPIRLLINKVTSNNQLRCTIESSLIDYDGILGGLVLAPNDYTFELENKLFDNVSFFDIPNSLQDYFINTYKLYRPLNNLSLPIILSNNDGTNLHQNYVCETQFFNVKENEAINPIIDMEKDVYYPAFYNDETQEFTEVNEIKIDLHFRSRDLEDWKITNENFQYYSGNTNIKNNWNIFDAYSNSVETNESTSLQPYIILDNFQYYQPSDLLYFLSFNDDDVFYQKNKISKSFLRLSFYDDIDPRTNSLLATSTVFLDSRKLYKKYIDNKNTKGFYISVDDVATKNKRLLNTTIGVNYEAAQNNGGVDESSTVLIMPNDAKMQDFPVIFDDEQRLSASFTIKNMFDSLESSEGFLLYIFRDYGTQIHERTIYLKIEFNHAGKGRTLTFMQPYKTLPSGEKTMLNITNVDDIKILKKGCNLQDLYSYIYIPINVKYDFKTKKYYYYLPKWLTEHNNNKEQMRLNLYELKIADES